MAERFASARVLAVYASRLADPAGQTDMRIRRHTYDSLDYFIGICRVVCNPCGNMTRGGGTENARFDPHFIAQLWPDAGNTGLNRKGRSWRAWKPFCRSFHLCALL